MPNESRAQNLNDVSAEEAAGQLRRVLESKMFVAAPQLRRFLEFVGVAAIEGRAEEVKEYTIGTHVFGRKDFDPRGDTLVRTQASRLRARLESYFRSEGVSDEILLEIPKGSYVPRFGRRPVSGNRTDRSEPVPIDGGVAPEAGRHRVRRLVAVIAGTLLVVLLAVGAWYGLAPRPRADTLATLDQRLLEKMWSGFFNNDNSPIICYSNHVSLINQAQDQLYYRGQEAMPKGTQVNESQMDRQVSDPRLLKLMGPVFFNDGLTGTGEVAGAAALTRLFTQMGRNAVIRRSQLLTPAELKGHSVVFLGSPDANALLRELPPASEFEFDNSAASAGFLRGRILNRHPQPGESAAYGVERDPATMAIRADYVVVSMLPGIAPGRKLAVLAGVSTEGTQAAAEFATSPAGARQIADHLAAAANKGVVPQFFQAVLRVEIAKSDILQIQYVAGRIIRSGP